MLFWLFFIFVAFGSKLLLGLATIFLLLDSDSKCSDCDGETILLRMGPLGRAASWLLFGQLQRRWCPRCGWEGTTRPLRPESEPAASRLRPGTPAA